MYINDVHIAYYIIFGILGGIVGWFLNWANYRMKKEKKILSKDIFKKQERPNFNYTLIILNILIYIILVYFCGVHKQIEQNLNLVKFAILIPMLISAFIIDYKLQIIPNRLNLTIFEFGLLCTFIYGINNINIATDMFLGMITGAVIFLIITIIRRYYCRKRGNGIW